MDQFLGASAQEEESEWLSVSDLMAGLMVIFLFIAIVFIQTTNRQRDRVEDQNRELSTQAEELRRQAERVREIALTWQRNETQIHAALEAEFRDDLPRWNAEIDPRLLLIRFRSPEVLFTVGQANLRPEFSRILQNFFPRYARVLGRFRDSIEEVRIEGHTSSEWDQALPAGAAYFENMRLSQDRTRAVLQNVLGLPQVSADRIWLQPLVTANGLSSSRVILTANGQEDRERSRRVEFRIRTKASTEIVRILEEAR